MGEPAENQQPQRLYRLNRKTQLFECVFPGCAFAHEMQGGVNLHYYKKHGPRPAGQQPRASSTRPKRQPSKPRPEAEPEESVCRHQWRLLRDRNNLEAAARQAGYTEVCTLCEEVRR